MTGEERIAELARIAETLLLHDEDARLRAVTFREHTVDETNGDRIERELTVSRCAREDCKRIHVVVNTERWFDLDWADDDSHDHEPVSGDDPPA